MRDKEADALVAETGKRGSRYVSGIEPTCCEEDGDGEGEEPLHGRINKIDSILEQWHCMNRNERCTRAKDQRSAKAGGEGRAEIRGNATFVPA